MISCTDWLDGYLARKRNEVTDFGKFMYSLADKILTTAALLALVELRVLPSWPVLIILAREFIVAGVRMVAASKGVVIAASWYGKAKTVFQIIAIVMFLVKDVTVFPNAADSGSVLLAILAGHGYCPRAHYSLDDGLSGEIARIVGLFRWLEARGSAFCS